MSGAPHMKSVDELLKQFNVSEEKGLTKAEVEAALKKYGPNGTSFLVEHVQHAKMKIPFLPKSWNNI